MGLNKKVKEGCLSDWRFRKRKSISFVLSLLCFYTIKSQNLQWAKTIGSSGFDMVRSSVSDNSGNIYATGEFSGIADFDPGPGIYTLSAVGFADIFITKFDGNGNFKWAKSFECTSYSNVNGNGFSIDIDGYGNILLTGSFRGGVDFDPGPSTFILTSNGSLHDIFISKLDPNGNFLWAKSIGGTNLDVGFSIKASSNGNIYTTGYFSTIVDFDPGSGIYNLTDIGVFILKLDQSGNFIWAKSFKAYLGRCIAIDSNENIFTIGELGSGNIVDMDPGPGIYTLTTNNSGDIYISKIDASGNFVWAKKMGGTGGSRGISIALDAVGNLYSTGRFIGSGDFDPNSPSFYLTSNGSEDIYISKLNNNGDFLWAKSVGGADTDEGASVATDIQGDVYITGYFRGTMDFDPGVGIYNLTAVGGILNTYILKLTSFGNFVWAKKFGASSGYNQGTSIVIDPFQSVYVSGGFDGTINFDLSSSFVSKGDDDGFVVKFSDLYSGTDESSLINNYIIHPNPSSSDFILEVMSQEKKIELSVRNSLGQLVPSNWRKINDRIILNIEGKTGLYFVTISAEGKSEIVKVLKN